jgi:hypothetical protein
MKILVLVVALSGLVIGQPPAPLRGDRFKPLTIDQMTASRNT